MQWLLSFIVLFSVMIHWFGICSSNFWNNRSLFIQYTCDAQQLVNPQISWDSVKYQESYIFCASVGWPTYIFHIHWIVADIPSNVTLIQIGFLSCDIIERWQWNPQHSREKNQALWRPLWRCKQYLQNHSLCCHIFKLYMLFLKNFSPKNRNLTRPGATSLMQC